MTSPCISNLYQYCWNNYTLHPKGALLHLQSDIYSNLHYIRCLLCDRPHDKQSLSLFHQQSRSLYTSIAVIHNLFPMMDILTPHQWEVTFIHELNAKIKPGLQDSKCKFSETERITFVNLLLSLLCMITTVIRRNRKAADIHEPKRRPFRPILSPAFNVMWSVNPFRASQSFQHKTTTVPFFSTYINWVSYFRNNNTHT